MKPLRIFVAILCVGFLSGCAHIQPPTPPPGCEDSFVWQHYYETSTGMILIRGGLVYWVSENPQYKDDVLGGLRELYNVFADPSKIGMELWGVLSDKIHWVNTTAGTSLLDAGNNVWNMLHIDIPIHPCDRSWAVEQLDSLIQRVDLI